jgi:hypothetical protein
LMEQSTVWPYDANTGLIFGRDSSHNPFLKHDDPEAIFRKAYPGGFLVRIIDGGHGQFFSKKNITSLARAINELIML